MDFKEIKFLAEHDRYDEALEQCEKLFADFPESKADILRTRAYVFARKGDYPNALRDREAIFAMGTGGIRDYFLAGNNALFAGRFLQASNWLNEVLRLGEEQNETWFKAGSYFLLAYAQMELGNYSEADANLKTAMSVEPRCAMPLPGLGMCDESRLREQIRRRQS